MNRIRKRFARNDQNAKDAFISQQANDLLDMLVAAGAQFYGYCGQQIMYLNGQVIDLFRKADVLATLKRQMNIRELMYARDTVADLRAQAEPLYRPIPEGTLGTISGIKEPEPTMTRFLHARVALWIKEAIESGKLSQTQGVQN